LKTIYVSDSPLNEDWIKQITTLQGHGDLLEWEDGAQAAKGGPGSGNFGHAGRPGEVGGSGPEHEVLQGQALEDVAREQNPDLIHRMIHKSFDIDEYEAAAKDEENYDWRYLFTEDEIEQQKHRVVSALYIAMNEEAGINVSYIDRLGVRQYRDFMYDIEQAEHVALFLNADKLDPKTASSIIRESKKFPERRQEQEKNYKEGIDDFNKKYPGVAVVFDQADNPKYVSYQEVSEAVHQWAISANDNHLPSLHMQKMVGEEFGVTLSSWQEERYKNKVINREKLVQSQGYQETPDRFMFEKRSSELWSSGLYPLKDRSPEESDRLTRLFVRKMYENTQVNLPEYPQSIRLYRGFGTIDSLTVGGKYELIHNPLESWTTQERTARDFAIGSHGHDGKKKGYVVAMDIPSKRLFATPATGIGSLKEFEVVLINSSDVQDNGHVIFEVEREYEE
jgi:hypothetical protein